MAELCGIDCVVLIPESGTENVSDTLSRGVYPSKLNFEWQWWPHVEFVVESGTMIFRAPDLRGGLTLCESLRAALMT